MKCDMRMKKKYLEFEFGLLFIMSMAIHTIINNTSAYYDDSVYWWLGKACGWDVRNIGWGFRGWVLPYVFSMCYKFGMKFGSEYLGYRIFASIIFSFTFTFSFRYILKLMKFEISDKMGAFAGAVCGTLFFIFFRGLLIYTLSDFYAFAVALMSVILLRNVLECERRMLVKAVEAFFLGICLYGAYNIRTIYLFSLLACWGVLIIWQVYQRKWKQMTVTLPTCFVGMFVCSVPQYIMNFYLSGTISWRVPTEGLMLQQLQWGITAGRYATYVGDATQYGAAGMFFTDNIGQAILDKAQITELTSYGQLIKLIIRYPIDFIGIYMRHLLNMLYPLYPNQYIQDITRDKSLLLIFFYTVLFIAVFYFLRTFKLKDSRWIWCGLVLLPCICILPGAVEIRFFIALHFLIYMYAVLGLKDFILQFKADKVRYSIAYLTGFLLYIAYAGMLLGTTQNGIAIIN